jgi:hypothetical protein
VWPGAPGSSGSEICERRSYAHPDSKRRDPVPRSSVLFCDRIALSGGRVRLSSETGRDVHGLFEPHLLVRSVLNRIC